MRGGGESFEPTLSPSPFPAKKNLKIPANILSKL